MCYDFILFVCSRVWKDNCLVFSGYPTSVKNEDTETRGSNCIRITDDCVFVAVCANAFESPRATACQTEGSKMTVYSDVRADLLGFYKRSREK